MKSTWQVINKLLGKNRGVLNITLQCGAETINEPIEVANKFNNYFSNIANNIRQNIPEATKNYREYLSSRGPNQSIYFYPTCPYEVGSEFGKSRLKDSTGIDGISSRVMKSLPLISLKLYQRYLISLWHRAIFQQNSNWLKLCLFTRKKEAVKS